MIIGILIVMALSQPGTGTANNKPAPNSTTTIFIYGNGSTTIAQLTTTVMPTKRTIQPPSGRLYALSGTNVIIINSTTGNSILEFSATGVSPQSIALSQDYGIFFVTDDRTNEIYGVNTSTYNISGVATVNAPGLITGGTTLLATSKTSPDLYELNSRLGLELTYALGSPGYEAVMSPTSGVIYVTNPESATVTVIKGVTSNATSTINVGADPTGLAVTPSGAYLLVSNSGSDSISVINTNTDAVVSTINLTTGSSPTNITMSPNGQVAFIADSGEATVTMLILSELPNPTVYSIPVAPGPTSLAISPSGGYLYVASPSKNMINVLIANFTNDSYPYIIKNFSIVDPLVLAVS